MYKVTTEDYPYPTKKGYFVDSRFVKLSRAKPMPRLSTLSPKEVIIGRLLSAVGSDYVWGGNRKDGVPEMLTYYPPLKPLSENKRNKWMFKGVDCSGLLYEATNGFTPRNTSSLLHFGKPVNIAGLSADQIIRKVKSLDLIVWDGHVIIVLGKGRVIESRLDHDKGLPGDQGGVKVSDLKEVLSELLKGRIPVNNYADNVRGVRKKFVLRRWHEVKGS